MRLACLYVPSFPFAAWLRVDPELGSEPVVVAEGKGQRAVIVACSAEAERRGIAAGFSVAQAKAIHSGIVLRPVSIDAERAAAAALCDVAHAFSPRVEDAGAGTVFLDIGGLEGLHGSETELARLLARAAHRLGLEASVGIASTKIAARLAACDGGGIAVIPPAEEWHFLAPLPIRLLAPASDARAAGLSNARAAGLSNARAAGLSPDLQETLSRWGIRSLGDLAALPASAVATRLGPEGALLARRARGEDDHPLVVLPATLSFEEEAELEYGVDSLEPFLFVLRALLDRLLERLALRGLICGDLRLSLGLAGRGRDERTVTVSVPSNEAKALLTLVRLHLEAHPPREAVEKVRLAAVSERLRPAQLDLFRPNGPAPAQLAVTLARLVALCGAERIGAPVAAESHRPDVYALAPFEGSSPPGGFAQFAYSEEISERQRQRRGKGEVLNGFPDKAAAVLALRAIRPPRELEVFYDRGHPDFVRLTGQREVETTRYVREPPCPYRCNGRVVSAAGPWRVRGEWWSEGVFSRDYYDVQLTDGAVYRIFCDLDRRQWFVDGVYD